MEKQRHFVLVHGACHGAWCWYKVASLLKSAGEKVTCLDMAGSGVNPKQMNEIGSFSDYFEPLMDFMASISTEEKVIIVGHSMGGICITAAMERFPEKIAAGVFATAFMPGPQLTYSALQQKFNGQEGINMDDQYRFDNGPNNLPTYLLFKVEFLSTFLYQLSPPEDLVLATLAMRPMTLHDGAMELTREKYGSVARVFIVCGQDKIITEDVQRWMIENNPTVDVKYIDDADHMVMFSKPDDLFSCLVDVANKYLPSK